MTTSSRSNLTIVVQGRPAPKGSKTGYNRGGRVVLVETSKHLPAWESAVQLAATLALNDSEDITPFDGPLKVVISVSIEPPKKPMWFAPAVKPDADKLARGILDPLTKAKVIVDDARVTDLHITERYCGYPGALPFEGAVIKISYDTPKELT